MTMTPFTSGSRDHGATDLPRSCVVSSGRNKGLAKVLLTQAEAEARRERQGGAYVAYPCPIVRGAWHVGRRSPRANARRALRGLYDELGARAFHNLRAENVGEPEARRRVIYQRWRH